MRANGDNGSTPLILSVAVAQVIRRFVHAFLCIARDSSFY